MCARPELPTGRRSPISGYSRYPGPRISGRPSKPIPCGGYPTAGPPAESGGVGTVLTDGLPVCLGAPPSGSVPRRSCSRTTTGTNGTSSPLRAHRRRVSLSFSPFTNEVPVQATQHPVPLRPASAERVCASACPSSWRRLGRWMRYATDRAGRWRTAKKGTRDGGQ